MMKTFPEASYKSSDLLTLAWKPEPGVAVSDYDLYVGQVGDSTGNLSLLASGVASSPASDPQYSMVNKVYYDVPIATVQSTLGISSDLDFEDLVLYFALSYTNPSGTTVFSKIVEVPPVGITGKLQKEDPAINRHIFGFSDELQRWIKSAATGNGALIVDSNDFYKDNITTEYSWTIDGSMATTLSYFSDRTTTGSPAKLTTYDYTNGHLLRIAVTDSTVV